MQTQCGLKIKMTGKVKGLYKDIVDFSHTTDAELIRAERQVELDKANQVRDLAKFNEKQANELVHATRAQQQALQREHYNVELERDKLKI